MKTINPQQYNKLLNIKEELRNKGIKPLKSKKRFYIGMGIFLVSFVIPDMSLLKVVGLSIIGISFFDIKNIYMPEIKRRVNRAAIDLNSIRGSKTSSMISRDGRTIANKQAFEERIARQQGLLEGMYKIEKLPEKLIEKLERPKTA